MDGCSGLHGVEPIDGNGLRERKLREPTKDQNDDMQSPSEERKVEKTYGRTPDGTGESLIQYFIKGRVKLV